MKRETAGELLKSLVAVPDSHKGEAALIAIATALLDIAVTLEETTAGPSCEGRPRRDTSPDGNS